MKRWLIGFAKIAIPVSILVWLVYRLVTDNPQDVADLLRRPKDWPRLILALSIYLGLVAITFVRWFLLVRSLKLPFKLRDAFRLGFISYLLQFVSLGAVGGDLFKALFLAREQPQRKPEAVATIFIDRIVGMLGLLLLASVAVFWIPKEGAFAQLAQAKLIFVSAASVGVGIFLLLLFTKFSLTSVMPRMRKAKFLRTTLLRVEGAIRMYREDRKSVVLALALGFLTHLMHGVAIYTAATAFFPDGPGLGEQVVMWAVAGSVGSLPIAPGGLGTFELAYGWLYERMATPLLANEGVLVALLYRVMTLVTAGVGIFVYLSCRREMQEVLTHEEVA